MKCRKIAAGALAALLLGSISIPAFADTAAAAPTTVTVSYADIDSLVRSNNQTIRANGKTLDSLNSNDAAEQKKQQLAASVASLQNVEAALKQAEQGYAAAPAGSLSSDQQAIGASLNGSIASIDAICSVLSGEENQLTVSQDTIDTTELQMNEAADQIVVAAQKLYTTFHTLNAERTQLQKQQQVLADTLKLAQVQFGLGLISQTDLLNAQQQTNTLADSLTALTNQMKTVKDNFQLLLGYSSDYDVAISSQPAPDADFLPTMNETADQQTAQDANWTVKEKAKAKEIADGNEDDSLDSTVDDYRAASLNYTLAVNTFQVNFRAVYNDVSQKQSAYATAQAAYYAKSKTLGAMKVKNAVGLASALDLENAQMDLNSANAALTEAQIGLFSSQEAYRWALRGVINTSSSQGQS